MPIFEYQCTACDARFEELVRSEREAQRVVCPRCGERRVARQLSVFAAHDAPHRAPARAGRCGSCDRAGGCPIAG